MQLTPKLVGNTLSDVHCTALRSPLTQRRTVKGIPPETDSMRQKMKRPTYGWYSKTGALRCTELHTTWTTAHSKNLEVSVTRQKRGWEGGKRFVMLRLTHGYGPTGINDSSPSYMKRCDSSLHLLCQGHKPKCFQAKTFQNID